MNGTEKNIRILIVGGFILVGIVVIGLFLGDFFFLDLTNGGERYWTEALIHTFFGMLIGSGLTAAFMHYFGSSEDSRMLNGKNDDELFK